MELLTEYVRACRADAGHSPATIRLRLSYLRRVPNLATATTAGLVDWLAGAGADWSPQSRASAKAALRSFYGWALIAGVRADDPSRRLHKTRVPAGVPHPCSDDVLAAALLVANDRTRLMISLGAYAGLRRAEIAGLRWRDQRDGSLWIVGKGGRERRVPVGPQLGDQLAAERARRRLGGFGTGWRSADPTTPYVFPGRTGGPVQPNSVGQLLARTLGDGWTAHSLRHRFGTRAYSAHRDLVAVQKLLGHQSVTTTTIYAAAPDDAAWQAVLAASA